MLGKGSDGCLGHGDLRTAKKARIVEALLGEEVSDVACSDKHVLAMTNGKEVFAWGRNEDGCLGLGDFPGERNWKNIPTFFMHENDDDYVCCVNNSHQTTFN